MDNQQTNLLCQTDIQTVDIQNLVDISDVKIDTTMKKTDRIQNFIRDIKNPYCFRCKNSALPGIIQGGFRYSAESKPFGY